MAKSDCPKSDRCIHGENCPREYTPSDCWYGCLVRGKPKTKFEQFSRADLIEVIKFATDYNAEVKMAIDKGIMNLGQQGKRD